MSIGGSFSFIEQTDPSIANTTDLLIGASGVTAFVGTTSASGNIGVELTGGQLGLVIYSTTSGNTTTNTYALIASGQITPEGLPSDLDLSGAIAIAINNTGNAISQSITTPDNGVINVSFADGSAVQSVAGSVTLAIGPSAAPLFSLSGDFTFTVVTTTGLSELEIGATNVSASGLTPNGDVGAVSVSNGTLGLAILTDTSGATPSNEGYALYSSATVTGGLIGGITVSGTVTIERNTIDSQQDVVIGGTAIKSGTHSESGNRHYGPAQQISLSGVTATSSNPLIQFVLDILQAAANSTTTTQNVASATVGNFLSLSGITLTFNVSNGSGTVTIAATSATLFPGTSFPATLTGITGSITVSSGGVTAIGIGAHSFSLAVGQALLIAVNSTATNTPAVSLSPQSKPFGSSNFVKRGQCDGHVPEFTSFRLYLEQFCRHHGRVHGRKLYDQRHVAGILRK